MSDELPMWTIYEHPRDYPRWFVVRRCVIDGSPEPKHDRHVWALAESLDEARAKLPPGLYRLHRQDGDDPRIVEVWF